MLVTKTKTAFGIITFIQAFCFGGLLSNAYNEQKDPWFHSNLFFPVSPSVEDFELWRACYVRNRMKSKSIMMENFRTKCKLNRNEHAFGALDLCTLQIFNLHNNNDMKAKQKPSAFMSFTFTHCKFHVFAHFCTATAFLSRHVSVCELRVGCCSSAFI